MKEGNETARATDRSAPNLTLRKGDTWVTVKPLSATAAKVEAGNAYRRGDLVEIAGVFEWSEAAETLAGGDTVVSPFDLELIFDPDPDTRYERETHRDLALAFDIADPRAEWESLQVELALDDREALAHAFSELLGGPGDSGDICLRRRRTDAVA